MKAFIRKLRGERNREWGKEEWEEGEWEEISPKTRPDDSQLKHVSTPALSLPPPLLPTPLTAPLPAPTTLKPVETTPDAPQQPPSPSIAHTQTHTTESSGPSQARETDPNSAVRHKVTFRLPPPTIGTVPVPPPEPEPEPEPESEQIQIPPPPLPSQPAQPQPQITTYYRMRPNSATARFREGTNTPPEISTSGRTTAASGRVTHSPTQSTRTYPNEAASMTIRSGTPYSHMSGTSAIQAAASWSETVENDLVANLGLQERTHQEVLRAVVASEERYVGELIKFKETFIDPLLHPFTTILSALSLSHPMDTDTVLGGGHASLRRNASFAKYFDHPSMPTRFLSPTHSATASSSTHQTRAGTSQSKCRMPTINEDDESDNSDEEGKLPFLGRHAASSGKSPDRTLRRMEPMQRFQPRAGSQQLPAGAIELGITVQQLPEDLRICLEVLEEAILPGHLTLCEELQKRCKEQYPLVRSLTDIFVAHSRILRGYAKYVLHLERALKQVENALSAPNDTKRPHEQDTAQWAQVSKALQRLTEVAANKCQTGLAISLCKPFQRLLKYPLLLQNLLFQTDLPTDEHKSTLEMVAEVERIVRSIEDEKTQMVPGDRTYDVLARIEGLEKVNRLAAPKPSRFLIDERPLHANPIAPNTNYTISRPPPLIPNNNVRGNTSLRRLSDALGTGLSGRRDIWLVYFNDLVLRCQRTGATTLPLVSGGTAVKLAGKNGERVEPRNLYKFIKVETWTIESVSRPRAGVVSMKDITETRTGASVGNSAPIQEDEDEEDDGAESDESDRKSRMSFSYWGADRIIVQPTARGLNGAPVPRQIPGAQAAYLYSTRTESSAPPGCSVGRAGMGARTRAGRLEGQRPMRGLMGPVPGSRRALTPLTPPTPPVRRRTALLPIPRARIRSTAPSGPSEASEHDQDSAARRTPPWSPIAKLVGITFYKWGYTLVDLTRHTDAESIRKDIISRLPTASPSASFDIFRTHPPGSEAALNDTELMLDVERFGDDRGSLKFHVRVVDRHSDSGLSTDVPAETIQSQPQCVNGTKIHREMSTAEILEHLNDRYCEDVTAQLGEYEVSKYPISNGGFGDVYRATHTSGRQIGLKCVRLYIDSTDDGWKKLKSAARELHTWSKCRHPNVLELVGVAEYYDRLAMVSPWMENGDLSRFLSRKPALQVNRCLLCVQIADGVTYLHQNGIVHGDLKGANILLSDDFTPKIIDFGVATIKDRTLLFSTSTEKSGFSIRWAAPEIIEDKFKDIPTGTDVYSLAMTILEVISGKPPYACVRRDEAVVFKVISKTHPLRPENQIPSTSQTGNALWGLLVRCWEYDHLGRPDAVTVRDEMATITPEGLLQLSAFLEDPEPR